MTRHRRAQRLPDFRALPLEDLVCAALFAFFAMQGAIPGIAPAQSLEMTASAPTGLTTLGGIGSQVLVNTVIVALLLRRPRLVLHQTLTVPCAALLAGLAVASTFWSLDPALTLRRSVPFALAGLFGLYFAARYSPARQLAILRLAMIALAGATIGMVLLNPSIGLDHSPGHAADWQGVFTQKNACGRIMVLATAVILFAEHPGLRRPARLAALALFLFVLAMSGSRGAWIVEGALLALFGFCAIARRSGSAVRMVLAIAAPVAIAAAGVIQLIALPGLALLVGRDGTLSGRTAIWAQVAHFILRRPLFGYGYDAFWRGMQGPSFQVAAAVHFIVAHAHNGFLEIGIELGAAGLVLFAFSWLRAWRRLWPLWRLGAIGRIAWPIAILVLIALYDLDENTLLIYNGLFWILYVAALSTIERLAGDQHHTRGPRPHAILAWRESIGPDPSASFAQELP